MTDPMPRFDHVVVLMFENRSFDNLFGYLYEPGEVPAFEGLQGRAVSNPVPRELVRGGPPTIPVHPARNMDTPDPDPGEEYPHINTQLFGTVLPPGNRAVPVDRMEAPFNAPPDPTSRPTMDGFVRDYASAFEVELGRPPTYEEMAQVMAVYARDQIPVLATLAREFACFDHWFCEVPSQTFANRSFFHAASSSGFVNNAPYGSFSLLNDAETIFERLERKGLSWRVYFDPEQILPVTALLHARRLAPYFATRFSTLPEFYEAARSGDLPAYSFLEPNLLHPHTDMHPPGAARLRRDLHLPPPRSMAGGERLLAQVYEAIRTSSSAAGSNAANTLLVVTFDEHGGIHDHVPPPPAPPPGDVDRHQEGFAFDRSGVRIPTVVVSGWVSPGTVVTGEFRSTSVIATLRGRWDLGPPLTNRDAVAPGLSGVLDRATPRPAPEWPRVPAPREGLLDLAVDALDRPLSRIEKDLVGEALALEARSEARAPDVDVEALDRRAALGHLRRIQGKMFPRLAAAPAD